MIEAPLTPLAARAKSPVSTPKTGWLKLTVKSTLPAFVGLVPTRTIEDTVGTANVAGLLSWLLESTAAQIERSEDNALRLGRIAGLVSLVDAAGQLAVAALDGDGPEVPARMIGVRLLARDIVGEIREMLVQTNATDEAISRALAAYDLLSSVAREPRKVRQARLGNSLWNE